MVLLYQPESTGRVEGMIVGKLKEKRYVGHGGVPGIFTAIYPGMIGGPQWDCALDKPTHWMHLPPAP